jgi:catechol 2,3-dioxygenase-like lactoylglutathione lyase family enzyme
MMRPLLAVAIGALLSLWQTPAAERPRVLGIAHVSIQVSDMAAARAFYSGVLGFAEDAHLVQTAKRAVYVINPRQRLIVQDGLPPDRDERLMNVGFDVDRPGLADTTDPDGHTIQFVSTAGWTNATAPDRRISQRLLHAGLTIKDVAAADRFYKDTLGFSEIWRGGRPEGTTSWINMRVPGGTDYLEYMLYPAAPPTRQQLGSAHHVALLVSDIQQALETVRARTKPGDRNHRATPNIGVNNRWQLNVFDPDGTRVEFMEPFTAR